MERRRTAMGLKKLGPAPEKSVIKSSRHTSSTGENSKCNLENKTIVRGKASQKSLPTGSVTPKQKTPVSRSNVTPLKPESPCSPLQSPGSQMMFPGTLASPEIEVSWDWSCSQVPNDMLPPKRTKRMQDVKVQVPALPTINMHLRPRQLVQRQITEEENQQRLEYYKNILSLNPSESPSRAIFDSTNNNVEDESLDATKLNSTPKRPTTRLSSSMSKKKDEDKSLFDDSANEFMIECSQAIEEKLRNGEIDMGPIVDIDISQAKRLHSPGFNSVSSHKKTCNGRVNLFPENFNRGDRCLKDKVDNKDQIDSTHIQKPMITSKNNVHQSNVGPKRTEQSCVKKYEPKPVNASLSDGMVNEPYAGKSYSSQIYENNNKVEANVFNSSASRSNFVKKSLTSSSHDIERRPPHAKPTRSTNTSSNINQIISSQNKRSERLPTSVNTTSYEVADNFCKPKGSNNTLYKGNQTFLKHHTQNIRNQQDVKRQENCITNQEKIMHQPKFTCTTQGESNTTDITSLLDDDFDLELSSLDVDLLCRGSETKESETKPVTTSHPKVCTKQEIEAKRLAALQKLKMKKRK